MTPVHAQQLAAPVVAFGNVQPATPPPSRPLEKSSRALRSPGSQELELWFRESTGDRKGSRTKTDKHRKKRHGHVAVRCIKKYSIEARIQHSDDAGRGRRLLARPFQDLGHMAREAGLAWELAPVATMVEGGREVRWEETMGW
jgi:hypothetical protein